MMLRLVAPSILSLPLLLAVASCGGGGSPDEAAQTADTADAVEAVPAGDATGGMTADLAIKTVKDLADRGAIQATVALPFEELIRDHKPCSAMAAETDSTCKPNSMGTMWFRDTTRTELRCCKEKRVPLPLTTAWSARYSDSDARWLVDADFAIDGAAHHATWSVDTQTRDTAELPLPK